jgi:outer membrane protein OmpA-like peptidoglycan-associated protein
MSKRYPVTMLILALLALPAAAQQTPPAPQEPEQEELTYEAKEEPRKPLEAERREGFFGKINPFARKKYVQRTMEPLRNRVNELDELTAANARAVRDLDERSQEGIARAEKKAMEADRKATEAGQRAEQAHSTAQQAGARLQVVEQVLENVGTYHPVTQAEIRFRTGQPRLGAEAKAALDEVATPAREGRGYVVEIHGFAPPAGRAGIERSQELAQAVARYLVLEHGVPVHRIYVLGRGNATVEGEDGKPRRVTGGGRVEVNLLKNNLDELQASSMADALARAQ